ncbi:MAG TPA: IPT/TIG domain-containing protein [Longimicrobium sp.]
MSNGILPTEAPANTPAGDGPGRRYVPKLYIIGFGALLTATVLVVFYLLLVLWPHPTPSTLPAGSQTPAPTGQANASQSAAAATDSAADTVIAAAAGTDSPSVVPPDDTMLARGGTGDTPRVPLTGPAAASSDGSQAVGGSNVCRTRLQQAWTSKDKPAPAACIWMFGRELLLWDEQRLLLLVLLGGALGGLLHVLRSFGWYVGNRELVMSWLPRYVLLITTGSGLAFVFYVVVRGGFFSPGTSFENTSPFGFVAFATLVGLFSEQAILKLKEISETLLSKPATGSDAVSQGTNSTTAGGAGSTTTTTTTTVGGSAGAPAPTIGSVSAALDAQGGATRQFTVQGTGFSAQSQVLVNDAAVTTTFVSPTQLDFDLGATPTVGVDLKVQVRNPDSQEAAASYSPPMPQSG